MVVATGVCCHCGSDSDESDARWRGHVVHTRHPSFAQAGLASSSMKSYSSSLSSASHHFLNLGRITCIDRRNRGMARTSMAVSAMPTHMYNRLSFDW